MITRRLPFGIVVALVLLAVGSVVAIAGDDESNPPSADVDRVTTIEPEAKEALDILARGRASSDALPQELAARMKEKADFGMNPGLSRRAIGNITNSVYVIPARDHICASLTEGQNATVICPPTDDVAEGKVGAATVVLETGDIGIYGVLPGGVAGVSVQVGASGSIEVPAEDNAYYTVVPAGMRLRAVRYVGPSGPVEFPIYDPALAFEEAEGE
jgi:hypothetical protein